MHFHTVLFLIVGCAVAFSSAATAKNEQNTTTTTASSHPLDGIAFDEIIVESSLNIRPKPGPPSRRRQQRAAGPQISAIRTQRQFYPGFAQQQPAYGGGFAQQPTAFGGGFGQQPNYFQPQQQQQPTNIGTSSSSANANSQSYGFGPNGFGSAAAQAQAQGFQTSGPLGGFGASATNANTQNFQFGPNGLQGGAGLSGTQVYNLPNGQSLNLAYSNGLTIGPDGRPTTSKANSITFSRR